MIEDLDETINNTMTRKLFKASEQDQSSDYYNFNPKKSNFKCYGCQIVKPRTTQSVKLQQKKKKRQLDSYKMNDIIIKPWHPFLREFQKIFKNSITSKYAQTSILQEYYKPDYVLQVYEIIRKLREQLLNNVNVLQQANLSVESTLETLATYSLDEMEINAEQLNSSNSRSFQQDSTKRSLANSSLRFMVQERKVQHYKDQFEMAQEQLQLLEKHATIGLKPQLQATIKAQKDAQYLRSLLKEVEDQLMVLQREHEVLLKENYFLFQYAQLDRHYLYIQIMKQYPADMLKETDASMFDIYLQEMEKEIAKLKLENTKLMIVSNNYQQETAVIKKESETNYSKEFKLQELKWNQERNRYESQITLLQRDIDYYKNEESKLKLFAKTLQEEKEKLQKQLNECQNGMNNVCQQFLYSKQQNEQLIRQNLELQQTVQQLDAQVTNINTQFARMSPTEQAKQLALIILSRERPNQDQIGILKQVFGEYADEIVQQRLEQSYNEQAEKLFENLEDLRNFKDKLEQQNRLNIKQIEEIRKEVMLTLSQNEQMTSKTAKKLNFDQDQNIFQQSLLRINEILNSKEEDLQKTKRQTGVTQINRFDQVNQQCMLLLQALTLEEFLNRKDEENFSDCTYQTNEKEQNNILQKDFVAIDEQEIEESSNHEFEDDIEENQPEPYQPDEKK